MCVYSSSNGRPKQKQILDTFAHFYIWSQMSQPIFIQSLSMGSNQIWESKGSVTLTLNSTVGGQG